MTAQEQAGDPSRSEAIAEAAVPVFLRYGLRKTSMDDLAAAAGLSRQGLYLHFKNKQELFHAALRRMTAQVQAAVTEALADTALPAHERLLGAFTALNGPVAATADDTVVELLAAANTLGNELLHEFEHHVVAAVAAVLREEGVPDRTPGATPEDLAYQLLAVAAGAKHLATIAPEDRSRHIRTAITLVLGPRLET
ncbi:TetR/AcrR family transcriptional regulator [Streptomonospora sediminis]